LTSQERKKIMEMKKMNPFHDGRLSSALYMMKTQPSCDAATYTVKKLVAATQPRPNTLLTSGQRPHRHRTWMVQSYSPGGANAHSPSNTWTHPTQYPKLHLNRYGRFCTAHARVTLQWATPPPPLKIAPSHGGICTPI